MAQGKTSHAILSYQGEPVCVTNTAKNPDLVPSFLTHHPASDDPTSEQGLPECGVEDMNRIYNIAQNSVLVDDPEKGVEVASLFVPYYVAVCASSAIVGGLVSLVLNRNSRTKSDGVLQSAKGSFIGIGAGIIHVMSIDLWRPNALVSFPLQMAGVITCGLTGAFSVHYNYLPLISKD